MVYCVKILIDLSFSNYINCGLNRCGHWPRLVIKREGWVISPKWTVALLRKFWTYFHTQVPIFVQRFVLLSAVRELHLFTRITFSKNIKVCWQHHFQSALHFSHFLHHLFPSLSITRCIGCTSSSASHISNSTIRPLITMVTSLFSILITPHNIITPLSHLL